MDLKRPNSSDIVGTNINDLTMIGQLGTTAVAVDPMDAINKNTLDAKASTKVNKNGDTINTPISLINNPSNPNELASYQYLIQNVIPLTIPSINTQLETKLNKTGDTATGPINVSVPASNNLGAVNKGQAEAAIDAINPSSVSGVDTGAIFSCYADITDGSYLRCNGSYVSKTTYTNLYTAIGDQFFDGMGAYNSEPWKSQSYFNTNNNTLSISVHATLPNLTTFSSQRYLVTNEKFYVFTVYSSGGNYDNHYTGIINSDGTLGAMSSYYLAGLPSGSRVDAVVCVGTTAYFLIYTLNANNSIYKAVIDSNGNISFLNYVSDLDIATRDGFMFVTDNKLFIVGGVTTLSSGLTTVNSPVRSFDINVANNELLNYSIQPDFPLPIQGSCCARIKDKLYVFGGFNYNTNTGVSSIYETTILQDGSILPWSKSSLVLPLNLGYLSCFNTANELYIIGGRDYSGSSSYNNMIIKSVINADGSLSAFTQTSGGIAKSSVMPIITSSKIYFIGGTNRLHNSSDYTSTDTNSYVSNFTGGYNNYLTYYNNNQITNSGTSFKLPNLTYLEISGVKYYIKT